LLPDTSTTRWYKAHVRRYGHSYRALGFGRRASQEKRFEAILALGEFHGSSLLDAGCGFGDLLPFMHARGIVPRYTGLDLCEPMIEHCRNSNTGDVRFHVADALDYEPAEAPYDYVVASGLFGLAGRGVRERIRPTVEHLFSLCRRALAVNFLSSSTPRRSRGRLYLDPGEMLQLALGLTPAVRLDHAYLPNDFTLCLYRTPPWQEEKS
jgi:SAM-dependent methyltransferase